MKKLLILLLSLISIVCWGQQYSDKWSDVDYVGDGIVGHKLDIYLPKTTKSSYPVVLYIYGSAWGSNNSKGADMSTVGAALLDAGYAVVCINHRSLSDAKWPAQINDVKAAIRFVRGNAVKYKFDTCFVGISGSSSGGHLSDVAGLSRNVKTFTVGSVTMNIEGTLGSFKGCSSSIDAVCDWFGPKYLIKMDSCGNTTQHGAADSPGSGILGCAIKTCTDNAALLEPKTYIDPTDPPFLIFHGTSDAVVPYCASVFLNKDLKAKGVQSEYVEIAGGGHYSNMHTTQNLAKMVTFFNGVKNTTCSGTPPSTISVSLTSPANNAVYESPASLSITATATTTSGTIAKVEFYNGSTKLGEDATSPYAYSWSSVAEGTYSITAVATDNAGKKATSTAVSVSVINPFKIYKTTTAITIDGSIDAAWTNASVVGVTATKVVQGAITNTADLSGTYKALWDNTYLYILADITDDTKINDSQNSYDDDAVEVYIDINNDKATSYGSNDRQFTFGWNDGTTVGVLPSGSSITGVTYSVVARTGGYILEARIPWSIVSATPAVDQKIGIDFMVNDDDDNGTRDAKLSWNSATDNAYQDPSLFGTAVLKDAISPCTPPAAPTVTTPVAYTVNSVASPLTATGTALEWYTTATGGTGTGTAPTPITTAIGTTSYYVSQTINSCESDRAKIDVVVSNSSIETISLRAGWNIIGCPIDGSTDIAKALSSVWSEVVTVKNLDSFYDINNASALNSLLKLEWGEGYMLKVKTDCKLDWIVK